MTRWNKGSWFDSGKRLNEAAEFFQRRTDPVVKPMKRPEGSSLAWQVLVMYALEINKEWLLTLEAAPLKIWSDADKMIATGKNYEEAEDNNEKLAKRYWEE